MTTPDPQVLQRGTSADAIARHTRNDIEAGRLQHQQQLPPTTALAEQWGVSVATISRAMSQLVDDGLVITKGRSARIVNYPPPTIDQPDTVRARRPQVILIGGYAGSGKTELARILGRQTGWPILDKDSTTRAVVEAALDMLGESPHDRESATYLDTIRPAEYEALIATMTENVECGNSAIVSAPFIRELGDKAWCDRLAATVESMGADLRVVWVRTDADSMKTYLVRRGAARDAGKLGDWSGYLSAIDVDFEPAMPHRIVHNSTDSRPLQQQAGELVNEVRR